MSDPTPDGSAPRLSLCTIVKNEEARLPRCLASVSGLVDEMIVTDTGSTDGTVAVAERAGANVHHFPWCDDFSAALNYCLDHVTGDWVFVLDADEQLTEGCFDEVHRLIGREDAFAYNIVRQDYIGPELREDGYTEMLQTRLFRNRPGVRFVGRIHQQLEPSLTEHAQAEQRLILDATIRIKHDGFLGADLSPKLERAQRLLELELRDRPDDFYYLVELGRVKLARGDAEGMIELGRAAEQFARGEVAVEARTGSLGMLLEELLARETLPEGFPISLARAEQVAADHFSTTIPVLWQRALRRFRANAFADAARLLERILQLAADGAYSRHVSFAPSIMGADAWLNLGVCYVRMTKLREAAGCFERIKDDPKHGAAAEQNIRAIAKLRRGR